MKKEELFLCAGHVFPIAGKIAFHFGENPPLFLILAKPAIPSANAVSVCQRREYTVIGLPA